MIYIVMLSATGFRLRIDGIDFSAGAVKVEYVFSFSKSNAIKSAMRRIAVNLGMNKGVSDCDPTTLHFELDEVNASWNSFLLLRRDGYVFFNVDPDSSGDIEP